jgi:hypothetical protein
LLIWLKLIFSRSLVAGKSWIGQDTRERRKKPFQYARGAMGRSYSGQTSNLQFYNACCIGSLRNVLNPFQELPK